MLPSHGSGLPPLPPSLWTVNITTYVTTILASVDDYLSWETKFTSFIIMHQLHGMLDGSILQPPPMILVAHDFTEPNPAYSYWLHVDQLIRAWIFATISKDMLCEVRNISHALPIWHHLGYRFNTASLARALDLKCMLTNVSKSPDQSMDDYLRHIKTLVDSLAAIQSPVFDLELI